MVGFFKHNTSPQAFGVMLCLGNFPTQTSVFSDFLPWAVHITLISAFRNQCNDNFVFNVLEKYFTADKTKTEHDTTQHVLGSEISMSL